jgi:MbtH protein
MTNPFENENGEYIVLVNEEGQYSLWPDFLEVPLGWKTIGPRGQRRACLTWIDENWTDMRPLSLVRQMEEDARMRKAQHPPEGSNSGCLGPPPSEPSSPKETSRE